jgi:hypothetical protein
MIKRDQLKSTYAYIWNGGGRFHCVFMELGN